MKLPKLPSRVRSFLEVFFVVPIVIGLVGLTVWAAAWLLENDYWPLLVLLIWICVAWKASGSIEESESRRCGGKLAP